MYKGMGVRFADCISFVLNISWKWINLVSLRPNYFIFIGYLKTGGGGGGEGVQAITLNPLWVCHWGLKQQPIQNLITYFVIFLAGQGYSNCRPWTNPMFFWESRIRCLAGVPLFLFRWWIQPSSGKGSLFYSLHQGFVKAMDPVHCLQTAEASMRRHEVLYKPRISLAPTPPLYNVNGWSMHPRRRK